MKRVILSESKHFLGWAVVPSPGKPTRWGLVPRAQKAKLLSRLLRHSSLQLSFPRDGWDGLSPVEALTYYKLSVDGEVLVEIDLLNFVYIVDGDDRLAEHRKALGI